MKRMNHKWDINQMEWKKTEYIPGYICCIRKLRKDKGRRIDDMERQNLINAVKLLECKETSVCSRIMNEKSIARGSLKFSV